MTLFYYRTAQLLVRTLWPLIGRLEVTGKENVPAEGPFILVSNHQSILDPILIQTVCPRPIRTMAKSTQFAAPIIGPLMPRLLSFPVRRYEIDPQPVRLMLRYLSQGEPVGVYLEGERSWDGRLQPFRLGTVRVVLKAGVPVVPARISGSYDVWPRWDRRPARGTVRIQFAQPILFGRHDRRAEREAALPDALLRLHNALGDTGDDAAGGGASASSAGVN